MLQWKVPDHQMIFDASNKLYRGLLPDGRVVEIAYHVYQAMVPSDGELCSSSWYWEKQLSCEAFARKFEGWAVMYQGVCTACGWGTDYVCAHCRVALCGSCSSFRNWCRPCEEGLGDW